MSDRFQRVLVTGGSGSLGQYIVDLLKPLNLQIRIMDITPCDDPDIEFISGDITKMADAEKATRDVDAVLHLAGIPVENGEVEKIFRLNVTGTLNMLEASARNRVKGFVYASSVCVYGLINWARRIVPPYFPIDENVPRFGDVTYSMSKINGEDLCHGYSVRYGIDTISLRIASVMRPDSDFWAPGIQNIHNPEFRLSPKTPPLTQFMWQYVHPKDVAQGFVLALQRLEEGNIGYEAFNIGAKDVFSTVPSLELIARYYSDVPVIRRPAEFVTDKYRTCMTSQKLRGIGIRSQIHLRDICRSKRSRIKSQTMW